MDKNIKDKIKEFFRKEGFYVVLLICLCLIATVAVLTMNNKNSNPESENQPEFTLEDSQQTNENLDADMNNAERVQENTETEVAEAKEGVQEEAVAETSSSVEVVFSNPVDGKISRGYTYPTPVKVSENTFRNIKGVDIDTPLGTPVKTAAEGVVESIGNGAEEGVFVIVAHSNGVKTKYANLDATVQVNKGDTLAKDAVIGKVGNTSKIYSNQEYGDHLNLQVLDSEDKQLDPVKYFNYEIKE